MLEGEVARLPAVLQAFLYPGDLNIITSSVERSEIKMNAQ
jgi:hypothetical protein